MEVKLKNHCNTLGSLLRDNLENECGEEFATCVVPEPSSDFLLVTVPNIAVLRRALLGCKEELKNLEINLLVKKDKRRRKES
jgi:DNA-directed RNA polymerase subunit L